MRKILVGTTNPSKPGRFQALLSEYDVEFYTLVDTKRPPARRTCVTGCPNGYTLTDTKCPPQQEHALQDVHGHILKDITIPGEPKEKGITPEENAILKAQYYGRYFDSVICNDSGLYFDGLALDDPRQPGLNVRTPNGARRLDDEEMIEYYSDLIHSLGGKVLAYYLDGFAVYHNHKIYSYMEDRETARSNAFYMVDTPASRRHPGWPLDSISIDRDDLTYFTDEGDSEYDAQDEEITDLACKKRLIDFLVSSLEL